MAMALTDAAAAFPNYRLPELFAGYPRREHSFPVSYTAANIPQAWASGAVVHLLETVLAGESADADDRLRAESESQVAAWRRLAGRWKSERTLEEETQDIYGTRTSGREVDL